MFKRFCFIILVIAFVIPMLAANIPQTGRRGSPDDWYIMVRNGDPSIEPSETYRDRPTTARNTTKVMRPTGQNITIRAPKPVALPLPPLNPM